MNGPVRFGHGRRPGGTRLLAGLSAWVLAVVQVSAAVSAPIRSELPGAASSGASAAPAIAARSAADRRGRSDATLAPGGGAPSGELAPAAGLPGPTIGGLTWLRRWPLPAAPAPLDLAFEPLDVAIAPGWRFVADQRNNGILQLAGDGAINAFWTASSAVTAGAGRPQAIVRSVTVLRPEIAGLPAPLADTALAVLWQRFARSADSSGLAPERAAIEVRRLDGTPAWAGLLPDTVRGARDLAFRGVTGELFVLADDAILRFAPLADGIFTGFAETGRTPLVGPLGAATRLAVLRDGTLVVVRPTGADLLDWSGQTRQHLDLEDAVPLDVAADALGQLKVLARRRGPEGGATPDQPLVFAFDSLGAAGATWGAATLGVPVPPPVAWPWAIAADGAELLLTSGDTRFGVYAGDPERSLGFRLGGPLRTRPIDVEALVTVPDVPERLPRLEMQADGSTVLLDPASGGIYRMDGDRVGPGRPVPLDSVDFTLGTRGELFVLTAGGRVRAYRAAGGAAGAGSASELLWSRAVDEAQLPQLLHGGWSSLTVAGDDLLVGLPSARRIAVLSQSSGELQNIITAGELENGLPVATWTNPIGSSSWAFWPVDLAVEHRSFGRDRAWALDAVSGLVIAFNSDGSRANVESLASHLAGLTAPPLRLAASLPDRRSGIVSTRLAALLADGTLQIFDVDGGELQLADQPRTADGAPVLASDVAWTKNGQLVLAEGRGSARALHLFAPSHAPAVTEPGPSGLQGERQGNGLTSSDAPKESIHAFRPGESAGRPGDARAEARPAGASSVGDAPSARPSAVGNSSLGRRPAAAGDDDAACMLVGQAEVADADMVEGETTAARLRLWSDCPEGHLAGADIVFVVDHSGSMAGPSFSAVQDIVASTITLLDGAVHRVGLVGFNATARVVVPLTYDGHDVVRGLDAMRLDGGTNLADALQKADLHLQHEGRPRARPVIVLLTDGGHNEGAARLNLVREAEAVRQRGDVVFAIGLGPGADTDLLTTLVDQPSHFFAAPSPRTLARLAWPLAAALADAAPGNILVDLQWPGAIGASVVDRSLRPRGLGSATRALWSRALLPDGSLEFSLDVQARATGTSSAASFARAYYTDDEGRRQVLEVPAPRLTVRSKLAVDQAPKLSRVFLPTAVSSACLRAPRTDIALVLDASRSLDEPFVPHGGPTKREVVWREADRFVDQLALGRQRGAVVVFNAEASALQPLTADASALHQALARPVGTAYASRIELGLIAAGVVLDLPQSLVALPSLDPFTHERVGRTIVLVTDGQPIPPSPFSAMDTAAGLRTRGVQILAVGLGPTPNVYVLRQLAGSTGQYVPAQDAPALADAFSHLAEDLACPTQ